MKKCRFCAEDIQDDAIKCKHCHEFLDGSGRSPLREEKEKVPWYYRTTFIVLAVCCVGPFALPLIWFCPQATRTGKIIWSAVLLVLTYAAIITMSRMVGNIQQMYQMMDGF
jgi:hypothetical protein